MLSAFGELDAATRDAVASMLDAIRTEHATHADAQTIDSAAFLAHVAKHVKASGAASLTDALVALRAADLWLAFACASGSTHAMTTFRSRYADDIRRALAGARLVGMDVEDLVQELERRMFVGSQPKIGEYSGRGDLRAWVRIVATRLSLDWARAKKNTADTPTDDARLGAMASKADSPDQAYFRRLYKKEVASAIEHAARSLEAEERNALREHYARGLSVDQIAAIHGIHRATAARRVQKARETLIGSVKRILDERHGLKGRDLVSVMGLVRSQLHLTMDRLLGSA